MGLHLTAIGASVLTEMANTTNDGHSRAITHRLDPLINSRNGLSHRCAHLVQPLDEKLQLLTSRHGP